MDRPPELAEGMQICITDAPEIAEFDTQLEGRVGCPHELDLVETKRVDERAQVRQRRFAHPDDPDLFGFDEVDGAGVWQQLDERCCRHPACGAAADHDNPTRHGRARP